MLLSVIFSFPNITINSITDTVMASAVAEISCQAKTPNYVRLERQTFPDVYDENTDFSKGLSVLSEAKDYYLVSTGTMIHTALDVAKRFREDGIDIGVIDIFTIPINENLLVDTVRSAKKVICLEEHFLPGGLGSAVCEILNDHNILIPVKRLGIPIERGYCYEYGGREHIRGYYRLDKENVEKDIRDFLSS